MKRVLILGATSHISHYLIPKLIHQDVSLTLFARHGQQRLTRFVSIPNVHVRSGNWNSVTDLHSAIAKQEIIFMATGQFIQANKNVVSVMNASRVNRLIVATGLGIENEVSGKFGQWNRQMMGNNRNLIDAAEVIKHSGLNFTLMRMAWLYDQPNNERYELIPSGQPFRDTQLTRQAAATFIADVVHHPQLAAYESVGVAEPDTRWTKPAFY
ncbi:saccharopine dehydrogenase [Secundilactobacillus paracollinoides]|uniref:Saccharopine dehydrogenase n=1 Tax=Secundilactobacillus paracollinoides TaxID=240427 RepID=A0A1B2IXV9_9LACO|nr:NAD(P)H-binding protein [Secundilactobacillus paracollinoides]ANZ64591.1 saccharopine dehydrogenase [Secundilactobacillus paracollinoides]ANZ66905.1 saccharopine dehydrogenase [Secundilactobacillus paracollinoides]